MVIKAWKGKQTCKFQSKIWTYETEINNFSLPKKPLIFLYDLKVWSYMVTLSINQGIWLAQSCIQVSWVMVIKWVIQWFSYSKLLLYFFALILSISSVWKFLLIGHLLHLISLYFFFQVNDNFLIINIGYFILANKHHSMIIKCEWTSGEDIMTWNVHVPVIRVVTSEWMTIKVRTYFSLWND